MRKTLNENDIVTLKGNQQFLVFKCFEHDGSNYALVVKLKDKEEDEDVLCIVKEFVHEGKLLLDVLRDEESLKPVVASLEKNIKEASKKEN